MSALRLPRGSRTLIFQVVGQLSLLAAVPVYSRAVSVPEVGIFQVATAIALLLQPLATFRLEYNIPIASTDHLARRRASFGLFLTAGVAVSCALVSIVCLVLRNDYIGRVMGSAAVLVFAYAWMLLDNAILIRQDKRHALNLRNLSSGLIAALLQIVAALVFPTAIALALAVLAGRVVAMLITGLATARVRGAAWGDLSNAEPVIVWRRNAYSVGAGVVTGGAMQALLLLTGVLFGQYGAAQLGMAQRITNTPTSLVAQALSQMFSSSASSIVRRNEPVLHALVSRWIRRLVLAAIVMAGAIGLCGPWAAPWVLGSQWAQAGVLISLLAAPLSLVLVTTPTMPLLVMIGREDWLFRLNLLRLGVILTATVAAGLTTQSLPITAAVTAGVWVLAYVTSLSQLGRAARAWDAARSGASGRN